MMGTYSNDVLHGFCLVGRESICTSELDEIEVILDEIALEGFQGQSPVAHRQDKGVIDVAVPDRGDIGMLQQVGDEVASGRYVSISALFD